MRAGRDFWSWTDANDDVTCSRTLEALHQAGALGADDLGWLEPALRQGIGAPPGIAIPWAAWATRIDERVHPPIAAGALAITVTILNARRSARACEEAALDACILPHAAKHEVPDGVTRWSLAARVLREVTGGRAPLADRIAWWLLGLGEYPAAAAPRNPPLGVAASRPVAALSDHQPPPVRASCGAREAVVLWTLPALLADQDLVEWSWFGQAVAEPIALLGDLVRLWLDPDACDLRDAALTPLVEAWLAEPILGARLLRAYAGERVSAIRRLEIRSLLASAPYRARLERATRRALASAKSRLPDAGATDLDTAAIEFLDALGQSFRVFDSLMAFHGLLSLRSARGLPACSPPAAVHTLCDAAETDARMAVAFLSESAPWPGSWGIQRFGVFGSKDQPVGQWFVRGMILRALLELDHDIHIHGEAARLLSEIPPGELRYFGPWRECPPDADSLGLMLELVAATGAERDRAETWIALLLANTDESGIAPTYFYRDLAGRPTTPSGEAWPGDDCNAVRLNLLCGLLAFDAARFNEVIQANAVRVLADSGAGAVEGLFHYGAPYTALAFLRFAQMYREKAIDRSLWGDIAAAAAAFRARMAACQRLDGGWGSPQRTAFCLDGCAMDLGDWDGNTDSLLLERGMRYLGEHQLADGSWPAEPLYLIPIKRGREGYHQGRALTTAFCAHALHAALAHRDR